MFSAHSAQNESSSPFCTRLDADLARGDLLALGEERLDGITKIGFRLRRDPRAPLRASGAPALRQEHPHGGLEGKAPQGQIPDPQTRRPERGNDPHRSRQVSRPQGSPWVRHHDRTRRNGHCMRAKLTPFHAASHIIKRFDTNAVSASSLFRAAFPVATEEEEIIEMNWIALDSRGRYGNTKIAGAEHDETRKLSGTWSVYRDHSLNPVQFIDGDCRIPAAKAMSLSIEYSVERFAKELIAYVHVEPEPSAVESENEVSLRSHDTLLRQ